MAKQIRTKFTDFVENHLYDDFLEPKPLPFNYRSKNKVVYYDNAIAVLENVKQSKWGQNGKGFRFLVSSNYEGETDFRLLQQVLGFTWSSDCGYVSAASIAIAREFGCCSKFRIHNLILDRLGVEDGLMVDHIDRHSFNNTISNLRVVSPNANYRNRSVVRDDHPNISYGSDTYRILLFFGSKGKRFYASSLDKAMLYFDWLVLINGLKYPLYIDHSFKSFYSQSFLQDNGIFSKKDILKLSEDMIKGIIKINDNQYQNINWIKSENAWAFRLRAKHKWVRVKLFTSVQAALSYREQFFIDNPQYITKLTKAYTKPLQQLKAKLFPDNKFPNIDIK